MKKVLAISTLAVAVTVGILGCEQKQNGQQVQQNQANQELDIKEMSFDHKSSYAMGLMIGENLEAYINSQKNTGMEVDHVKLIQGIKDALDKNPKMTKEDIDTVMKEMETKAAQAHQVEMDKAEQQAKDNLALNEKFLEENAKKEGVMTTTSGLQYKVEKMGQGVKPQPEDSVKVHYTGKFLNGDVFDSSVSRGEPTTFVLNQVIPGWVEGIQLMPQGSKFHFYIPPQLGYGERRVGQIPGNSLLEFEVELLEVQKAQKEEISKSPTQESQSTTNS